MSLDGSVREPTPEERMFTRLSGFSDLQLVARWHEITRIVQNELNSLNLERQCMQETVEILNGNERFLHHPGRRFVDYARSWYGNSMAAAYRRQTDANSDSASLRVLLEEMKCRPAAYRFETLHPLIPHASEKTVELMVMSIAGAVGLSGIDVKIVQADLDLLNSTGKNVRDFVNKHLAHTDRKKLTNPIQPTFDEIHAAQQTCEKIAKRWIIVFTGANTSFDVITPFEWHDVFDFPWRARSK
jgi:hypothetical protein